MVLNGTSYALINKSVAYIRQVLIIKNNNYGNTKRCY